MIKCRKIKISDGKSQGTAGQYGKPEYPKVLGDFAVGIAERFENAEFLSVCADIVSYIE